MDPFNIQQCKMLEASLNIHVLDECLKCPETAYMLVKSEKQSILESDMSSLIASALHHDSAHLTAMVAAQISWNKLWDIALDRGTHGTSQLQRIVCHLSRHIYCKKACVARRIHSEKLKTITLAKKQTDYYIKRFGSYTAPIISEI